MKRLATSAPSFDEAYYRRFYGNARTRVQGGKEVAHLGAFLVNLIRWYGETTRSVLEVGAGVGLLRDWFRKTHPHVKYVSTEYSAHAAKAYGHEQRDITSWRSRRRFDLVVCQGVLPYLDDRDVGNAIDNLAAMTRGFFFLEAITGRDYRLACDKDKTDPGMHLRSAAFYRARLARHFRALGGGVFYRKDGPLVFWELESPG